MWGSKKGTRERRMKRQVHGTKRDEKNTQKLYRLSNITGI